MTTYLQQKYVAMTTYLKAIGQYFKNIDLIIFDFIIIYYCLYKKLFH
jgi:hypothetical protein